MFRNHFHVLQFSSFLQQSPGTEDVWFEMSAGEILYFICKSMVNNGRVLSQEAVPLCWNVSGPLCYTSPSVHPESPCLRSSAAQVQHKIFHRRSKVIVQPSTGCIQSQVLISTFSPLRALWGPSLPSLPSSGSSFLAISVPSLFTETHLIILIFVQCNKHIQWVRNSGISHASFIFY